MVFISKEFAEKLREKLTNPHSERLCDISRELAWEAERRMCNEPLSITQFRSNASNGGPNDYYSEGPYWWPDPADPDGPYVRRDGEYNPKRFDSHRTAMERASENILYLASAGYYLGKPYYTARAAGLIRAWFLDKDTKMNPHLEYAQAIPGVCTGRGIGIIDTNTLIKVIHGAELIGLAGGHAETVKALKDWFSAYLHWMNTSENGLEEKHWFNNHMSWWTVQAAAYAAFTDNPAMLDECFDMYKTGVLAQMNGDGGFADELERTRSYMYNLFNLQACTLLCEIAFRRGVDLWHYQNPEGQCTEKGVRFVLPYVQNPFLWPHKQISGDFTHDDISLQLGALRLDIPECEQVNAQRRMHCKAIKNDSMLGPIALLPSSNI